MAQSSETVPITVGILTISDTASKDKTKDKSGPILQSLFPSPQYHVVEYDVVPDDKDQIQKTIVNWVDAKALNVIITTGGTGFGVRDATPEAVLPLLDRLSSGLTHLLVSASLSKTPYAALSRPVTGIRKKSIILTVPGSPKGARENVEAVLKILPHAVELACGGSGASVHDAIQYEKSGESEKGETREYGHDCVHHRSQYHAGGKKKLLSNPLDAPVTQRQRHSPYPMISVDDALDIISAEANPLETIEVPVDENLVAYVVAEDIVSLEPVPGYRASIVDGYAVVAKNGPGVYAVSPTPAIAAAVSTQSTLTSTQVTRITTGAPLPPSATAVVMVEETSLVRTSADGKEEEEIMIHANVEEGENVREVGSDVQKGDIVMKKGEVVTEVGGEIGILASVGVHKVHVHRRPTVGVFSTGNEVIKHTDSEPLKYGQIRDTNRPTLLSVAKSAGFCAIDFGIVKDNKEDLGRVLSDALSKVDVLITTGGVSMGEMDLLKPTLERSLGAIIHFGRVKMKPGKPTTFATVSSDTSSPSSQKKFIFALPGNPVSATVTFYLFVLPALRKLSGYEHWKLPIIKTELPLTLRLDPRPEYQRAVLRYVTLPSPRFVAYTTGQQRSSRMLSMRRCNALIKLPPKSENQTKLEAGTFVDAILVGELEC